MSKFLYPIYKLKTKSYIKWWLYHKKAGGSGILSEILQGFSFNLENTLNRKFKLFEIEGNIVQDGTPSPDNEVPIYSAGDNENLFDTSLLPITKNGVTISKDSKGNVVLNGTPTITSGYINFNVSATKQFNAGIYTVSFAQKKVGIGSTIIGFGNGQLNLTLDETVNSKTANISNAGNARFDINVRYDAGILDNFILNPKLEKGNKATPYSPYGMGSINEKIKNADETQEQDYSMPVQQPMRSIGDVRDCFVKKSDGWYERHYIGEKILNGTENWSKYDSNMYLYIEDFILSEGQNDYVPTNYLSDHFTRNSLTNAIANPNASYLIQNVWGARDQQKGVAIRVNDTFTDLATLKTWLTSHNTKLQYELAEPLDLPCTEEQIQQLENKPSTYKDFTIINSEDETPAYLKIQYYKEG